MKSLQERFDEKTKWNGDCLEWQATGDKKGYGHISIKGKMKAAHKVAWQMAYGYWPDYLLHSCDNPPCVNINHLREGTHLENMADRTARGRLNRSDKAGKAPLSDEIIKAIKDMRLDGNSYEAIAKALGISSWSAHKYAKKS